MVTLVCPLCCDEEFPSQLSLKYHLLSITDNMYCPECSTRFDSILQLANHLDGTCGKSVSDSNKIGEEILTREEKRPEETNLIDEEILEPAEQTHKVRTDVAIEEPNIEHCHSVPDMPMEVDTELDTNDINFKPNESENIAIQNGDVKQNEDPIKNQEDFRDIEQIVVKEEHKDMAIGTVETQRTDMAVAPAVTEQYACSSCDVTFSSIVEHIQKYHIGQEVMINVPGVNNEALSNLVALPEGTNANVVDENGKSSTPTDVSGSNESQETATVHHKEKSEFVKKREIVRPFCLFKENTRIISSKGKLKQIIHHQPKKIFKPVENSELRYISKEVKIGKFWEKQAEEKQMNSPVNMEKILNSGIKKEVRKFPLKKNSRPSLEKLFGGNLLLKGSDNREMTSGPCQGINRVPEVKLIISPGDQGVENTISVYTCSTCQKEFGNIYAFERHSCAVAKTSSLVCKICVVQFTNLEKMQSHMRDVHGIKCGKLSLPIKCELCNVLFTSARAFKQHEKMHRPVEVNVSIECPICHIICSNNRTLSQHMKIHTNKLQIKINEENGEKSSIKTEVEDLPKILVCKECCKILPNNEDLKTHWQEHVSMEDEDLKRETLPEETNESPKDDEGERMQNKNNTESFAHCHKETEKSCKDVSSKYHVWTPM